MTKYIIKRVPQIVVKVNEDGWMDGWTYIIQTKDGTILKNLIYLREVFDNDRFINHNSSDDDTNNDNIHHRWAEDNQC